jgi:hypothetical protein
MTEEELKEYEKRFDGVRKSIELRKEYDMYMSEQMKMSGIIFQAVENAKLEDARNMLLDGLKPEKAAQYTNLPIETIQSINLNE